MPVKTAEIKTRGLRFVRFYPSDWRSGCLGLSLEQEGLYVRICSFIYETQRRLPLIDSTAAKFLGTNTNAYRKVRDQLVALGKLCRYDDGWSVARVEREIAAAIGTDIAASTIEPEAGNADQDAGREACQDAVGVTQVDAPQDTPPAFSKTANENNGPSLEPITNSQEPKKESPKPQVDFRTLFRPADENHGVVITEAGHVQLVNGTRQFWLDQFGGDAKRLDLALLQIDIQTGSRTPIGAQINRKLSQMAADKHDRDQRYQTAVASNAAAKAAPKSVKPSRWGA